MEGHYVLSLIIPPPGGGGGGAQTSLKSDEPNKLYRHIPNEREGGENESLRKAKHKNYSHVCSQFLSCVLGHQSVGLLIRG